MATSLPRPAAFQSTPPRGRRLVTHPRSPPGDDVSIHASAREATPVVLARFQGGTGFQSTPPRGRRLEADDLPVPMTEFQSTPPRGRRLLERRQDRVLEAVSIHASAREATPPPRRAGSTRRRFNPRLRAGGDKRQIEPILIDTVFQSTPPRGRRPAEARRVGCNNWFQSTPPRGRRLRRQSSVSAQQRFQSTPPRGRRLAVPESVREIHVVSIHASAREATRWPASGRLRRGQVSIHASAREATG